MTERVVLKRGKPAPNPRARKAGAKKPPPRRKAKSARPWLAPTIAVSLAIAALGAAWLYRLPDRLWLAAANGVAAAGFEVRDVELTGNRELTTLPVYTAALDGASDSMLLVDLDEVKQRLELLPWVAEASVGRILPDRLTVDIVEREPAAIWQNEGRHQLIDVEGRVLPADDLSRFAHLPLVADKGAEAQVPDLIALLADYPALAERLEGAVWRSERRWNFHLKSGEILMMPEDEAELREALNVFVRMERDTGVTGRGFLTVDFRVPEQMIVRKGNGANDPLTTAEGTEI
ncbi:FtsQ-type POTRA domain-containing protein [Pacificimonas sp. WHA3]|uniref:Cell division protein FtsQ n=1 Tax=Pacificimonas pallii TaxID=2827236 RepID=A0ABS6SH31_9SPHN|nr:cell division protein FtsQ/DivIB [Pacificimonas pallii]MBV7257206.1 FtsQ-type POTRA domain-containing protein [Pacificimonas pallii]